MYLVFCFLGCVVKFPDTHGKARVRILTRGRVCVFFFFLSFSFLVTLSIFSTKLTNAHTHTNKGGAKRDAESPKGDREHFTSFDFWITG